MSESFFNGKTDAELANGSRGFAQKITLTPEAYGLTSEQAAEYSAVDAEWQTAYRKACDPLTRTSARVAAKRDARRRVRKLASSLALIIRGNSNVTTEQLIGLGLGVRDKASPLPPPGTPYRLEKKIDGDGSLILKWKCDNPPGSRGTQYEIWRKHNGGEFVFLCSVGKKTFRDYSLPQGATGIVYKLCATRSTKRGEWAFFPISIGGGMPNTGDLPLPLAA